MTSRVLSFVINTAETVAQDLNPVIAAAVNAANDVGHVIKEIRVMTDQGETKVQANTVPGVNPPPAPAAETAPPADATAPPAATATETPVTAPTEGESADLTIDQKRDALLAELDALDKEEEAADAAAANPTGVPTDTPPTPTS